MRVRLPVFAFQDCLWPRRCLRGCAFALCLITSLPGTWAGGQQPTDDSFASQAERSALADPADAGGQQTYDSLASRLFDAYFNPEEAAEETNTRRSTVIPWDSPPFPFADHLGAVVGYRDTSVYPLMYALYHGPNGDWWKNSRIKIYGWAAPAVTFGTSRNSNIPLSYAIVPNSLQLSQATLVFERVTDSVQTENCDWGFKVTNLYGMDYRYTTAKGWFSNQLLKHNRLYGYDPLQLYADLYVPWVAQGMIVRLGRFISPIDIEAQLAPDNYLYTHSLMNTYDPFTLTGIQFITRVADRWTLQIGAHAGSDMAPWTTSSQANGLFLLKWASETGNNSLFGGLDAIGKGYFSNGHEDLQVAALTWSHKFSQRLHTISEGYYVWERSAFQGGNFINGPAYPFYPFVGPRQFLPGLSDSLGFVNFTAFKTSDKSYLVWRNDVLYDPRGFRTGFEGTYFETTLGFIRHITPWCISRPEIRFDYSTGQKAYDNGTRRDQFTFNWDIIIRF
jgi:Putative beta-barrel porin-2, OmpL-like. bbp2